MNISDQLCKFVEKQFNYPESTWFYEHVETTLGEIFDIKDLLNNLSSDKKVDTFTYFSMGLDDDQAYPFIVQDDKQILALGYIVEAEMKCLYLTDGKNILKNELNQIGAYEECVLRETVG
ncbi:SAUGI family uracil-DNA glycosylase inhibitor [Macrococcus animalis]|uniref:SAUGI family uracil-DNA glycosylase inhibitor n=1 Tax=Macrococcus animalis TaxID=3395467 RepID=UPI0039BE3A92